MSATAELPTLVITSGDPAGVGPEVVLKALAEPMPAKIRVLGDRDWLEYLAKKLSLSCHFESVSADTPLNAHRPGQINVQPISVVETPELGKLNKANSAYVLSLLDLAHQQAMYGMVDAIVTAPVHKGVINSSGTAFSGHTEYLASAAGTKQVVMMLACAQMRVALATTHLPLTAVSQAITPDSLCSILAIIVSHLQSMGITKPRIRVLGLNPHAGEQGVLGNEEITTIEPALERSRHLNAEIIGPLPADTAFSQTALEQTDVFLAMYHDQGLPVIKFASFGHCANVTLGLPYVRTSVDHGTALDIAASLSADASSMKYALRCAQQSAQLSRQIST